MIAFKITKYALILIAAGFALLFLSKRDSLRQVGNSVMGLGLIFFGMGLMSDATGPLRSYPTFIDAMQAIPTDGVEPMAHPLDATQRLRSDEVTEDVAREDFQAVAPSTEDGYYLVPRVVE